MSNSGLAGEQTNSQVLYQRQKELREVGVITPGPIVVAAGLNSPENIGMVLRLADAAGVSRVLFVNQQVPNPARIRKTARSTEAFVNWEIVNEDKFLQVAATLPTLVAVELTSRSTSLFETALPEECALVIGSEQHGIPAPVLALCGQAVHIPMFGVNGSINVTHALAIALFEWRRQHAPLT